MVKRTVPFPQTKRSSIVDGRPLTRLEWRSELAQVQFLREQIYLEGELGPHTDGAIVREAILRRLRAPVMIGGNDADTTD